MKNRDELGVLLMLLGRKYLDASRRPGRLLLVLTSNSTF